MRAQRRHLVALLAPRPTTESCVVEQVAPCRQHALREAHQRDDAKGVPLHEPARGAAQDGHHPAGRRGGFQVLRPRVRHLRGAPRRQRRHQGGAPVQSRLLLRRARAAVRPAARGHCARDRQVQAVGDGARGVQRDLPPRDEGDPRKQDEAHPEHAHLQAAERDAAGHAVRRAQAGRGAGEQGALLQGR